MATGGGVPSVVIEANFRAQSAFEREKVRALCERPVEVHCRVPVEVAAARYAERGAGEDHHPVHVARSTPLSFFEGSKSRSGWGR